MGATGQGTAKKLSVHCSTLRRDDAVDGLVCALFCSLYVKAFLLARVQGIEIGSGFSGSRMLGSEHNDEFYMDGGEVRTRTNRCCACIPPQLLRSIASLCNFAELQVDRLT